MFAYQKLDVWQLSKQLVIDIYKLTNLIPKEEKYGLISQMNRAAISIASNITEGSSRKSGKEQAHFTEIAYGSLMELSCQMEILKEIFEIDNDIYEGINKRIAIIARKLSNLRHVQKNH